MSFAEFTTDRSQVLGGPNLEQSKDNFTRSFVRRPEFVERYGNADTSENFVDAIIHGLQTWSNIDLSSQRGALLDAYNSGLNQDDSRRLVLRLVIQDVGFLQAEYNRSFVLMQYFGYLQRDPDVGGYEFWLDVINNREPNNYRGMVLRVRHVGRIPAPLQLAGDSK